MEMTLTAIYADGTEAKSAVANECQIWRKSKETFGRDPDARILVKSKDGTIIKDLSYVQTKRGMQMVNAVKKSAMPTPAEAAAEIEKRRTAVKHKGCIFITA